MIYVLVAMIFHNTNSNVILLLILFQSLLFSKGKKNQFIVYEFMFSKYFLGQNSECDDQFVNIHMNECYRKHIDQSFDVTSNINGYFVEGNILCQFVSFNL